MATVAPQRPPREKLHPQISGLLDRTRESIRRYVWIEGIALAVASLIAMFWIGITIDYLPVRLGSSEMPVKARAILLVLILLALLYIIWRWIWQRFRTDLKDRSLALLIERKFPEFHDSLVTTVEAGRNSDLDADPNMLVRSQNEAVALAELIDVQELFDYRALLRAITIAAALVLSLLLFAFYGGSVFRMGLSRLFGLSSAPYPRTTQIELIGFDEQRRRIVPRGDDLKIQVRADATRDVPVPTVCTIYYETGDGERGRVNMSRLGAPRDGFQQYAFDGMPFTNILSDIRFDVVGNDHRLNNCQVQATESPQIAGIEVEYELPEYTRLLARHETYRPGLQLPVGSKVKLSVHTNKLIRQARIADADSGNVLILAATEEDGAETHTGATQNPVSRLKTGNATEHTDSDEANEATINTIVIPQLADQTTFSYEIDCLMANVSQGISLLDQDNINSRRPYSVVITAMPDTPPSIDARLRGIGSAITPDVRLPFEGSIQDDFRVARSWIQLESGGQPRTFPIRLGANGNVDTALDLRKQRADADDPFALPLDSKVTVSVHAEDEFDLEAAPNTGDGDRYELDVVSPSRLLALLEARELGLRRRFEQIISDFRETRDSLSRVQFKADGSEDTLDGASGPVGPPASADAGDADDSGKSSAIDDTTGDAESDERDDPERNAARAKALRLLRVQRAAQQSQRAAQEVLGVALSFDDVKEELVNNRVDSEDRQRRLEFDIAEPLKQISSTGFPDLIENLKQLEAKLTDPEQGMRLTAAAVTSADDLLVAMERILQKMLDLESYNELVDLVRSMIREQDLLMEETKKQQKKRALDLLK